MRKNVKLKNVLFYRILGRNIAANIYEKESKMNNLVVQISFKKPIRKLDSENDN